MRPKIIAITAFISCGVLLPDIASANFYDGNMLYDNCRLWDKQNVFKDGLCIGYISGLSDTYELMRQVQKMPKCMPTNATSGQIMDIVRKYMEEHPENRNWPANLLGVVAIQDAFCPTK